MKIKKHDISFTSSCTMILETLEGGGGGGGGGGGSACLCAVPVTDELLVCLV